MLTIRQKQLKALETQMLRDFESRMLAHLRRRYPERTKDQTDGELRAFIRKVASQAEKYYIKSEKDVRRYLECSITFGLGFDRDPKTRWAGQILRKKSLTGSEKMDQITEYELFALKGHA